MNLDVGSGNGDTSAFKNPEILMWKKKGVGYGSERSES